MRTIMLPIAIALALSACTTATVFDPRACPRERVYTEAEQRALLAGMKKSPAVIRGAMVDYGKLRDMARACRGETP